jgi:hypothetical protein
VRLGLDLIRLKACVGLEEKIVFLGFFVFLVVPGSLMYDIIDILKILKVLFLDISFVVQLINLHFFDYNVSYDINKIKFIFRFCNLFNLFNSMQQDASILLSMGFYQEAIDALFTSEGYSTLL